MAFDEMLERVRRAWPEKRTEASKNRLRKVWLGKLPSDRIPFVFERFPDENGVNLEILESFGYSKDVSLYFQLYQLEKRAVFHDDYIPSLYTGYRQNMIPSGFGASETIKNGATLYWSEPLLKRPEDIACLKEFNPKRKGSTLSLLLENIKYFRKETRGLLPVHLSDSQDAMANASTMMDINDYFPAMATHPNEINNLHRICNKAIIKFLEAQIEASEGDYIGMNTFWFAWIPPEEGISLSIDHLAMIGPKDVSSFVVPYLNEIAARFGGLLVHSCGRWNHNMEAIGLTKGLRGIDFGVTESSPEEAFGVFGRNTVMYALHNSYVAVNPMKVQSQEDYIKKAAAFIKKYEIPAMVQIFMPPEYGLKQAMELDALAVRHLTF